MTSLTADEADPRRLLDGVHLQWGIENGLHYRREVTLHEDSCRLASAVAQHILAIINNLVLGLLLSQGVKNVPTARRRFDAQPATALAWITGNSS